MIRRIKIVLPVLKEQWRKRFYIDTIKALKPTKLVYEDLDKEITFRIAPTSDGYKIVKKGGELVTYILRGSLEGREMACEEKETGRMMAIDQWEVSKFLHPEEHSVWTKEEDNRIVNEMFAN